MKVYRLTKVASGAAQKKHVAKQQMSPWYNTASSVLSVNKRVEMTMINTAPTDVAICWLILVCRTKQHQRSVRYIALLL